MAHKTTYWVCSEGVLWSLYPSGESNYRGPGTPVLNSDKVLIMSFDGEQLDEYTAWSSLSALALAIESESGVPGAWVRQPGEGPVKFVRHGQDGTREQVWVDRRNQSELGRHFISLPSLIPPAGPVVFDLADPGVDFHIYDDRFIARDDLSGRVAGAEWRVVREALVEAGHPQFIEKMETSWNEIWDAK